MRGRGLGLLGLAALGLAAAGCAARPALVDSDPESGFALYRSGALGEARLEELCAAGVEEIVVLNGDATERECRLRDRVCPGLRVRFDGRQDAHVPLGEDFLSAFDAWIEEARREGRKVAFRCRHGWHRTGRLAAWYRIRFQGIDPAAAVAEMNRAGRFMWRHRQLEPQVEALADLAAGRPCSTAPEHCPFPGNPEAESAVVSRFAVDACADQ